MPVMTADDPSAARREGLRSLLRVLRTTALLAALYLVVPFDRLGRLSSLALLLGGLVLLVATLALQTRSILKAERPRLRAIEIAATALVLLLMVFSASYISMSYQDPVNFSQPLDRATALYFCVTVLSTVGFGDIVPRTGAARLVVSLQMLLDLVLIGAVARIIVDAARRGVELKGEVAAVETPTLTAGPRAGDSDTAP
jgi:voltage-gated potassium channel